MIEKRIGNYLNEAKRPTPTDIRKFVKSTRTWFEDDDWDEDEGEWISFITREHGDVGREKYGKEDWKEAVKLEKLIKRKFKVRDIEIEPVDEWIILTVLL